MSDDKSIVVIASYGQPIEAHMARLRLGSEGIEAVLHDENVVAIQPLYSNLAGGVKLLVKKSQVEKACEILEVQNKAIAKAEIRCPKCNSDDYSRFSISNVMWIMAAFTLGLVWLLFCKKYRCNTCGHNW
jgi:Putative prokaryotic signal transducing protein